MQQKISLCFMHQYYHATMIMAFQKTSTFLRMNYGGYGLEYWEQKREESYLPKWVLSYPFEPDEKNLPDE